jgi:hypothetical protein
MSVEEKNTPPVETETVEKSDGSVHAPQWTEAEETAVRHKLDWQIVPTVTILYLLCFLDRCVVHILSTGRLPLVDMS